MEDADPRKPPRAYGAPWRREALARLLREAGGPVHRRDLAEAVGTNAALLAEAVAQGAVRRLGSGLYEDASLPRGDAGAAAEAAILAAGRPVRLLDLSAAGVSAREAAELRRGGSIRRNGARRYSLPAEPAVPSTERARLLLSGADRPVSLSELRAAGVSASTVGNLVLMGRLRRVGRQLYAATDLGMRRRVPGRTPNEGS